MLTTAAAALVAAVAPGPDFALVTMQRFLRRPSGQRRLEAVSGAALAGLGARLLLAGT